jgi:hypothetical protein
VQSLLTCLCGFKVFAYSCEAVFHELRLFKRCCLSDCLVSRTSLFLRFVSRWMNHFRWFFSVNNFVMLKFAWLKYLRLRNHRFQESCACAALSMNSFASARMNHHCLIVVMQNLHVGVASVVFVAFARSSRRRRRRLS